MKVDIDLNSYHGVLNNFNLEENEGVKKLTSWKSLSNYWPNQPLSDHLHVIVHVQAPTERTRGFL